MDEEDRSDYQHLAGVRTHNTQGQHQDPGIPNCVGGKSSLILIMDAQNIFFFVDIFYLFNSEPVGAPLLGLCPA